MAHRMMLGVEALEGCMITCAHDIARAIALLIRIAEGVQAWVEGLIEAIVAAKPSHLTLHPMHLSVPEATTRNAQRFSGIIYIEVSIGRNLMTGCCVPRMLCLLSKMFSIWKGT